MEVLKGLFQKNSICAMICLGPLFFYSCYSVERDCKKFHVGSFEFSTLINGEIKTSYFTRTEDLEIESYEEGIKYYNSFGQNLYEQTLYNANQSFNAGDIDFIAYVTYLEHANTIKLNYLQNKFFYCLTVVEANYIQN